MEDDLIRIFGGDNMAAMMDRFGMDDETPIDAKLVSKTIENAQKRVENNNFEARKHVLDYDDVMNQQREIIYGQRRQVLDGTDMHAEIINMRHTLIEEAVKRCAPDEADTAQWDITALADYLEHLCMDVGGTQKVFEEVGGDITHASYISALEKRAEAIYATREKMWADANLDMREFERVSLLRAVDTRWMDHIDAMDQLRDGIGLRAIAHRDPINEYTIEGFEMFDEMIRLIQEDTTRRLYFTVLNRQATERTQVAQPMVASHGGSGAPAAKAPVKSDKKVGRNDPCPCGSGKKYKNCCGRNAEG